MWKTILAVVGVVLAVIAVWLLADMRGNDTRDQFVACKVENVQLTIQYGHCLSALGAAPGGSTGSTPTSSGLNPSPGGMITDPDPGGMLTDADDGSFIAYGPTKEKLEQCARRNAAFRAAVEACGEELRNLPQ